MTTRVSVQTSPKERFQVDMALSQTVGDLKAEIHKLKDYAPETQELLYCGRLLKDSETFSALGLNEKDSLILLLSSKSLSLTDSEAIDPLSLAYSAPSSSTKGKEVVRYNGEATNEPSIANRSQWTTLSPISQTISQPQPPSSSLSAWQTPGLPSSSRQNYNQIFAGAEGTRGLGMLESGCDLASIGEMIRTNPTTRQAFIEHATQLAPAFGEQLRQNPKLLDSLTRSFSAGFGGEYSSLQLDMLSAEEQEAVQRLVTLGFNEKQVVVAYIVSEKNEQIAANFLLNVGDELTSDMYEEKTNQGPSMAQLLQQDPSYRERLTQCIAQKHPELAAQIKANPLLFEMALQAFAFEKPVLTSVEIDAVKRLENLGFERQKVVQAYLICDKNDEHAANYLLSHFDNAAGSEMVADVPAEISDHTLAKIGAQPGDVAAALVPHTPAEDHLNLPTPTTTVHDQPEGRIEPHLEPGRNRPDISDPEVSGRVGEATEVGSLTVGASTLNKRKRADSASGGDEVQETVVKRLKSLDLANADARPKQQHLTPDNSEAMEEDNEGGKSGTINEQEMYGAHENIQGDSSLAKLLLGSSAYRQGLGQYVMNRDPTLGQLCDKKPALFEKAIQMARQRVDPERTLTPFPTSTLSTVDKEAIQRLLLLGFDERQATEAYVMSGKNEEDALITCLISLELAGMIVF